MPTYEYTCRSCGKTFDVYQRFSDKPLRRHDECGGELQKVFHPRGIVFKGPGFYANDSNSRKSSDKEPAKTDKPPASTAASTSSE